MHRVISITAVGLMVVASGLQASAAPKPNIVDPLGDANFVNDQGTGDGSFGDQTAADAGTVSDIVEVTISNDKKNLYVFFGTEAAPPAATAVGYRLRVNPDGTGGAYCLLFEVFYQGANNTLTAPEARLVDTCEGGDPIPVEVLGTQLIIPRSASKAFGKGMKLTAPQAQSFQYSGSSYPAGVIGPYVDTTKVGKDFAFKK